MPKIKSKKALAKRIIAKKNGTLKRAKAYRSHRATGKTTKQKRHLRKATIIHTIDMKRIKKLLQK